MHADAWRPTAAVCVPPVTPQLLLLENVRFYKEEEKNVPEFAQKVRRHAMKLCVFM